MTTPRIRTLALLHVTVILGVAVGIGLAQWTGGDPPVPDSQATAPPLPQEQSPGASLPEVPPLSEVAPGPRTIADWIDGETMPDSAGDGQISGLVLLDGAPLAGIQLTAEASTARDVPQNEAFIEKLQGTVRQWLLQNSLKRHCQTDEKGLFLFESLDGGYQYHILAEGYLLFPIPSHPRKFPVATEIELFARVRSERPAADMTAKPPWATGGVDKTVLVGYVEGFSGFGTLVIADGHGPLSDPLVYTRIIKLGGSRKTFRHLLDPGNYTVSIVDHLDLQNEEILGSWLVDVESGFNEVHLAFEPPPTLEVTVSTADGQPVRNARFSWHISRAEYSCPYFENEGDRYLLKPPPKVLEAISGASPAKATLRITKVGFPHLYVPFSSLRPIEARFAPVAWCNVEISDYLGSGFEGRVVFSLSNDEDPSKVTASRSVDWLGGARLGPLVPGIYQLKTKIVKAGGGMRGLDQTVAVETANLGAGDNLIQVQIPLLYSLVIDLDAELLTFGVHIRSVDGQWNKGFRPVGETLTVENMPAGEYIVTAGTGSTHVHIPQEDSILLRSKVFNTLLISRIAPGTPAENGLLKVGDLVIAINGVFFSNMAELQAAFGSSRLSSMGVTIIRDGVEMDLKLSGEDFAGAMTEYIQR